MREFLREYAPWLLSPSLLAFAWLLVRVTFNAYQKGLDARLKAVETAVSNARTDLDALRTDVRAKLESATAEVRVAVAKLEAEDRARAVRVEAAEKERAAATEAARQRATERRIQDDSRCDEKHVRVDEQHDNLRGQIDDVREKLAELTAAAIHRSEWARDRETLLAQTEAILARITRVDERLAKRT